MTDMSKPNITYLPCDCGDPSHYLRLWLPHDDEYGLPYQLDVAMGWGPWMPWRWRLRTIWRLLRGREAPWGEVFLHREDAEQLRALLNEFIARKGEWETS